MLWERGVYDVCLGAYLLYQLTLRPSWYAEPMPPFWRDAAQRANDMMASTNFPSMFRHECATADVCPFGRGLGVLFFVYLLSMAFVDWGPSGVATSRSYVVQRSVIGVLGLLLTLMNPVVFMRLALPLVVELGMLAAGAHEVPGLYATCGVLLIASVATHAVNVDEDMSDALKERVHWVGVGAMATVMGGDRLEPTMKEFLASRLPENVAEYEASRGTTGNRFRFLERALAAYHEGVKANGNEDALREQVAREIRAAQLCDPKQKQRKA